MLWLAALKALQKLRSCSRKTTMSRTKGSEFRNSLPFFQNSLGSLVSMTTERLQHPIGLKKGVQQV